MATRTRKTQKEPTLYRRLRQHFRTAPAELPVLTQKFDVYERPNLQMALSELLAPEEFRTLALGVVGRDWAQPSLARLSRPATAKEFEEGSVEYADVPLAGGQQLACVKRCLFLLRADEEPIALLITDQVHAYPPAIDVEVMGRNRDAAERFLRRLTRETRLGRAFRGQVLSVEQGCHHEITIQFHRLPQIRRDDIILPETLLQRIERHTMSFSRHADKLRASKRHIKRGILLYGPPGTGKTLSAMYLAAQMPGRTVLLITGNAVGAIEAACRLARMLEPATVILEDADLIGTERNQQTVSANVLLCDLLNQMDGLAEDADVLFILTSNRPEILEPALAARPGRIDQAIEIPPPDADCRRRLIDLYGQGLRLELRKMNHFIERTEGVSAAFIRELLRKAAVYAAEDQSDGQPPLTVRDEHLTEGLTELLIAGGPLTQSLLGGQPRRET